MSTEYYIGLMSGTSLDGVDAALITCTAPDKINNRGIKLLAHHHEVLPENLRVAALALSVSGADELHRAAIFSQQMVEVYALAVRGLLAKSVASNGEPLLAQAVRAIGLHGQTVRHQPASGYSIQLAQPTLLAERTGCAVVTDFRSADLAAGGQGAPLVPAFHQQIAHDAVQQSIIVNIGGMANLTFLGDPADRTQEGAITGFDCGPGNVLLDAWCAEQCQQPFDRDGAWGAEGKVIAKLLQRCLADPFFARPPPKSCGRDEFSLQWLQNHIAKLEQTECNQLRPVDVQATLLALTVRIIADAIRKYCTQKESQHGTNTAHTLQRRALYACGGGAYNLALMRALAQELAEQNIHVTTTADLGWPVDTVEAAAFAWLAYCRIHGKPGNVPTATGARGYRVLGAIYPAPDRAQ